MLNTIAMRRTDFGTQGFTIVEAMVSLCVLSFSLMAVFGTLNMCSTIAYHSRMLSKAVFLAERLMVETKLSEITSYDLKQGQEENFHWAVQISPTPVDGLGAIVIKVSWMEKQNPKQYNLRSLTRVRLLQG